MAPQCDSCYQFQDFVFDVVVVAVVVAVAIVAVVVAVAAVVVAAAVPLPQCCITESLPLAPIPDH